jgi:hypothetical protein
MTPHVRKNLTTRPATALADADHTTEDPRTRVLTHTGVDLTDPDILLGRRLAAMDWLSRTNAGQDITFEELYAKVTFAGIEAKLAGPYRG